MIWRRPSKSGGLAPEHNPAPTPSRAVYGFTLFLLSKFCLVMYLLWVLLPDSTLHSIGLDFFPQKYWAVAMPLYLCLTFFIMVVIVYPSLGRLHCTHPWDQYNPVGAKDMYTIYRKDLQEEPAGGVPPVHDMEPHEILQYLNSQANKQ